MAQHLAYVGAMKPQITLLDAPTDADRAAILAPLRAYNVAQVGDPRVRLVALVVRDDEGETIGGLWGRIAFDWCFVELLVVPESHRGQGLGRDLMVRAEALAREAGCVGLWLDTFEFQARGFYERLGYSLFGELGDYPPRYKRFFLQKRLV